MKLTYTEKSETYKSQGMRYRVYDQRNFEEIPQLRQLSEEQCSDIRVVSCVLPFRVNQYVIDHLIRWDDAPHDPIFRLVFPQKGDACI